MLTVEHLDRLEDVGFGVGLRLLELLVFRERNSKREIQLLKALLFLQTTLWRYLFGRDAQDLEQSNNVRCICVHRRAATLCVIQSQECQSGELGFYCLSVVFRPLCLAPLIC